MARLKKAERERREKERIHRETDCIRRKVVGDFFISFSRHIRPWLLGMAERYIERGIFPMLAQSILPSYYEDKNDKEIAAFASLLLAPESEFDRIQAFREMMGEHPFLWFGKRDYVILSTGANQNKLIGGVPGWKIARLMEKLWQRGRMDAQEGDGTYYVLTPIMVTLNVKYLNWLPEDVILEMIGDCLPKSEALNRIRLALLVLLTSDGIGQDVWSVEPERLRCPLSTKITPFLETWFPDYTRYGTRDEAIELFDMPHHYDFFYAYLAYMEIGKRKTRECSRLATTYRRWYDRGDDKYRPAVWREIMDRVEQQDLA